MFSTLKNTLKKQWFSNQDNLIIKLYTPTNVIEYQVFSVYEIKAESYYATPSFASDKLFLEFLNTIRARSIHNFDIDLSSDDQILTLSTCSNNNAYRTVLHAKKIN